MNLFRWADHFTPLRQKLSLCAETWRILSQLSSWLFLVYINQEQRATKKIFRSLANSQARIIQVSADNVSI